MAKFCMHNSVPQKFCSGAFLDDAPKINYMHNFYQYSTIGELANPVETGKGLMKPRAGPAYTTAVNNNRNTTNGVPSVKIPKDLDENRHSLAQEIPSAAWMKHLEQSAETFVTNTVDEVFFAGALIGAVVVFVAYMSR